MPQTNTARSFWIPAPGRGELRAHPLPDPGPGEVRVRALFSGISRGTESLVFQGRVPPSQYEVMRAPFQEGDFPGPVKYGYASVGRVEALGSDVDPGLEGRNVFCLHPHQDRYVVPASAVQPVPEDVPVERAVLAPNLETAINGVWDARPCVGDRIAVVGGGVVGLLAGWLCAGIPGTEVALVDPVADRGPVAASLGMAWRPGPDGSLPPLQPGGADLVVHASGSQEGLVDALGLAGIEATVLELSWFGEGPVALPLGEDFHPRRLRIQSSQVGSIPPARRPRWDYARRLALALDLLREPALDALLTGESPFEALPEVMARLADSSTAILCHRIRYGG